MFNIHKIASLELPELAPYRTLRRSVEHAAQGIFVAEGDKVVRRLLASDFGVLSVLLPESRVAEFEPLLRGRPASTTSGYDSVPSDSHQKRLQSSVRALGSSHIDFGTKVKWHRRCCSGFRGRRSSLDSRRRVRSDTGGDCHCVERTG